MMNPLKSRILSIHVVDELIKTNLPFRQLVQQCGIISSLEEHFHGTRTFLLICGSCKWNVYFLLLTVASNLLCLFNYQNKAWKKNIELYVIEKL